MSLKSRFDLVIFDWAGTMVDFGSEAPVKALIEAFGAEGVLIDAATARRDMGKAKIDHVRALLMEPSVAAAWRAYHGGAATPKDIDALMARLGPLMRDHAARASALIPGARETFNRLRAAGLRVASSTGYTREMMEPVLARAAEQGYVPEHVVCSGETPAGRPSPLMIYKACAELGVWPLSRVVKVDDAEVGIAEGKAAGAFTVGVASGNALGLSLEALQALSPSERASRIDSARQALLAAGADLVIDSVADLVPALEQANRRSRSTNGTAPARRPARP
ncbi:MAG: phosphonoacetaldehyde hydrolase [Steroidobacteraceae bacterium]|jgi:phosphonoacetaldehyde hydrolase|nr:phosphonoacetaldehyde hydrolase [Steroidobacteraceae bacterium]